MRRPATQDQNEVIPELVQQIVEAVQPLRIILFGSAARGEMEPETDIDLLVVMPEGTPRRRTAQHLYRTISGAKVPFDLVVATPGDLERHRDNIGLVYRASAEDGRIIYAAPRT